MKTIRLTEKQVKTLRDMLAEASDSNDSALESSATARKQERPFYKLYENISRQLTEQTRKEHAGGEK